MKWLAVYYDGSIYRVAVKTDVPEVDDEQAEKGFSNDLFGVDEDCEVVCVVEVHDNVDPSIFNADGDELQKAPV